MLMIIIVWALIGAAWPWEYPSSMNSVSVYCVWGNNL